MISNNKILLFDIDIIDDFDKLTSNYEIGLISSESYEKTIKKIDNKINFNHIFFSCNSIYYRDNKLIYERNIKDFEFYKELNKLIKFFLRYLSCMPYILQDNIYEIRYGIIYLSFIGTNATKEEKNNFIKLDKIHNYRNNLIFELKKEAYRLKIINTIEISFNDDISITIIPKEWTREKILNNFNLLDYKIYYFTNNIDKNSNNYNLFYNYNVISYKVSNIQEINDIIMNIT